MPEICLSSSLNSRGLGSSRRGSALGGGGGGGGLLALMGSYVVVLLSGGVDGDLDGDLTALDLFAVHLSASLLLKLFRSEGNESEATALASLTTSLELLDHESGDGAKGDLGGGGLVVLEDLEELECVKKTTSIPDRKVHTLSSFRS